jgi:DNA-binding protein H-NS
VARSTVSHAADGAASQDFSKHSFAELVEIKKELERELQSRQAKEIEDLRTKVADAAHTLGVSVEEIYGVRKREARYPKGKQPAKYRGPNGEEWSGKGPSPKWMKPLLVKGKTKADFLIK